MNNNQLYVGAARMILDYPDGFFPHKGFRGRYFTGVHDELHVRAVYIKSNTEALLISLELGDIGDQWIHDISEATGVPEGQIYLTASHTHSAPHVHSTIREDVIDEAMGEQFASLCKNSVLACAGKAKNMAIPAVMSSVSGICDINCNRDYKCEGPKAPSAPYIQAPNIGGVSDKTLDIIRFSSAETGRAIAHIVNYAVHSTVTFYQTWTYEDSMLVSSDLAGRAMTYVEDRMDDGSVTMFTMAAAGDQLPKYVGNHRTFEKDGEIGWEYYGREASFALCDAQGVQFGREILALLKQIEGESAAPVISSAQTVLCPMGKVEGWHVSETSFTDEVKNDGTSYADQYKESAIPDFHYTPTQNIGLSMQMLKVGNINMVFVPAEIVCRLGMDIKTAVNDVLGGRTIVITQCNGAFSYIVDRHSYDEMTFEAIASHFMPGTGEMLVDGAGLMARQIKGDAWSLTA